MCGDNRKGINQCESFSLLDGKRLLKSYSSAHYLLLSDKNAKET